MMLKKWKEFLIKILTSKTKRTMKEFMNTMEKDYQKENFTKTEMMIYGVLVPMALVAVMAIAGWLESL